MKPGLLMAKADQTGTPRSRFMSAAQEDPDPAEQARRRAVREALLEAARDDFPRIAKQARNGYSKELEQRSAEFTEDLRRGMRSDKAGVVMLDPNQFFTAVALGMDDEDAARAVIKLRGMEADEDVVSEAAESMRKSYIFRYGPERAHTQSPSAHGDYFTTDPQVCVIVPTSAYYVQGYRIEGMTRRENIDFINRHEGWHCLDTKYSLAHVSKADMNALDARHLEKSVGHPGQLEILSIANHREALADLGGMGDVIRRGADPKIIDGLIAWRRDDEDPLHMSVGALTALKAEIEKMGVKKFRSLGEDEARALYERTVDANAASPRMMEVILAYQHGTAEERRKIEEEAQQEPEAQKALAFRRPYWLRDARDPAAPPVDEAAAEKEAEQKELTRPLSPGEQKLFEALRQYDAAQMLQDRAFREDHRITPASLAKAYGEMQEELRRKLDREPANPLYQAQATKLQESFVYVVQELDYVAANAKRGVDIMKDPALKDFRFTPPETQAEPPAQPDAPQPGAMPARPAGAIATRAPRPG
jgi:hypothetical protein